MAEKHHIYWWNLENLFDLESSNTRPDWLKKRLKKELKGWTAAVLNKKLDQLSSVIQRMNDDKGPDILGVCEIENEAVVRKLMDKVQAATGRNYSVLHQDTKDQRGIDIAIIYDKDKYTHDGHVFSLEIMKRNATRDVFQATLTTASGNELILLGNHWPSRLGGKYSSEPYRMMVGETLSYWVERIHQIKMETRNEKSPAIVLMGDFNDNPFDRSLTEYLRSTSNQEKVKNSTSHILYNLMHQFSDGDLGTHVYGSEIGLLDQFIVSKSLITDSAQYPFQVEWTEIVNFPEMIKGDYNTPVRFSRPSKKDYNEAGYSDHLPIGLVVNER